MAVKKNEAVEAELLKQFRAMNDDFMAKLRDKSDKVNNDIINFNDIGADPNVLINNASYPIASAQRTDDKIPVSLFKLETENTIITDDELYALPYDKNSSVMQQHKDSLKASSIKLGLHSLAPTVDSANTPVIRTTGTLVGGRRRLTFDDLVALKQKCDDLEIDEELRNLVLCSNHANDLLLLDNTFKDRYANSQSGKLIMNIAGFNMYSNTRTPVYDGTTLNKKAYGAAAAGGDLKASVLFTGKNAIKAVGSVKMYYADAKENPKYRQSEVGFRMYFLVHPLTLKGQGAIIAGV